MPVRRFGMATRRHPGPGRAAKRLPADRRRQQLLDVALSCSPQRGFNATTMDDIAEAAGVTKPLLYQHFVSKRALYLELLDSVAAHHARGHRQGDRRGRGPPPAGRGRASPPTSTWW